jgi:hypothetical protein
MQMVDESEPGILNHNARTDRLFLIFRKSLKTEGIRINLDAGYYHTSRAIYQLSG